MIELVLGLIWIACFCYHADVLTNINDLLKVNLCYLVNTLTNTNDIPKLDFCYLTSALTNIYHLLKIISCHPASILTNTDNKARDITKKKLIASNQLFISLTKW